LKILSNLHIVNFTRDTCIIFFYFFKEINIYRELITIKLKKKKRKILNLL
jgi:hypothetical protein